MDLIPRQTRELVQGRVDRLWIRGRNVHHLVIGTSGTGKTGLIVNTILPLCTQDRMLFIDVKAGTDPMLEGVGRPIGPRDVHLLLGQNGAGPNGQWWRLVVDPVAHHGQARAAVRFALEMALSVGDIVVASDEVRAITQDLSLSAEYQALLTRGRSNGVSVISASAATDSMQPAVRTQWSFAWLGAVNNAEVIRHALGILGLPNTQKVGSGPNPYWAIVRDLAQFEWLYLDKMGAPPNIRCMARMQSWNQDAFAS